MEQYTDDLYEVLDELNAGIEDLVNAQNNPDALNFVIPLLHQKVQDFLDELQQEIEKLELIEVDV